MPEKRLGDLEQRVGLLDVGHMPAPVQDDQPGAQGTGIRPRRRQRDWILAAVHDARAALYRRQLRHDVIITEALPDRLLHATDHAEGREIPSGGRIGKVAGDAELEGALAVRLQIALAEP